MNTSTIKHLKRGLRLLAFASVLTWSMGAQALLIETHGGIELQASMIAMPSSDNGALTIKECSDCERRALKTNAAITQYVVRDKSGNSATLSRQDFAAELLRIGNSDALVVVFYALDTQTVTEARLTSNVALDAPVTSTQGGSGQNAGSRPDNGQSESNRPAASLTGGFSR